MTIRPAADADRADLVRLIAEFRVALAGLEGRNVPPDATSATAELAEYAARDFPIFVADIDEAGVVGYLVCRVDGKVVWAESLFVLPDHRRRGIASALYDQAERLAARAGGQTVFNWIHPNNDAVIAFLRKRGYDVLNLIEIRRPIPDEPARGIIRVGDYRFRYRPPIGLRIANCGFRIQKKKRAAETPRTQREEELLPRLADRPPRFGLPFGVVAVSQSEIRNSTIINPPGPLRV